MAPFPAAIRRGAVRAAVATCVVFAGGMVTLVAEETPKPPTLTHLFPAGGARGATVTLQCNGDFTWPPQVWAPGLEVVPVEEKGRLEVNIPSDLAADRAWIRLYNEAGTSASLPFLVGGLPELMEEEPNNSPGDAQLLTTSQLTINGVLQENDDVDAFAVKLTVGETLVAAVDANRRLGSPMDAILQVTTPEGIVVAENHDDVGLDPRLAYTATGSGKHIVRVFAFPSTPDTRIAFRGGDSYIYRLTLTTGPFITHAVPLAVSQTDSGDVEVRGWNIPPGTRLPVVPFGLSNSGDAVEIGTRAEPRTWPCDQWGILFSTGFAGAAHVRRVPYAVQLAEGQTDAIIAAAPLPVAITGCLTTRGEADVYSIPLKKGQQVVIAVDALCLDLPLVPLVRLTDPAESVVVNGSVSGAARDAMISHTATQDGDYQLSISDRFRRGDDRYCYRLTVREEVSDFTLSASVDALVVTMDKPAELTVKVTRHTGASGPVGPIKIQAVGLPPGVTAPEVISEPEGDTSAEVKLTFTTSGPAFSGPIQIRGTADQPHSIDRLARTPDKHGATFRTIWMTVVAGKPE